MYISNALALAVTVGLATAHPFRSSVSRRAVTSFPAGTSFDILLNKGSIQAKTIASGTAYSVIDIDLFDSDAGTIANLKTAGKTVICYFSAGTREDWRDDKGSFQSSDYGKAMEDWQGENWVNVKSDNVKAIMKTRIALAKEKGCDAVDPDNVDGFSGNQDGWNYKQADYAAYVKYLAQESATAGLAIGLKNALDLIPDVLDVVQFAVNEQCHEYSECDRYKPFTTANKAVFNIEYGGNNCDSPAGVSLTILNKSDDQALNQLGGQCAISGGAPLTSQPAATTSAKTTVTATNATASSSSAAKSPTTVTASVAPKPTVTLSTSLTAAPSSTLVATKTSAAISSKTTSGAKPTKTASDDDEDEDEEDDDEDENEDISSHRYHGEGKHN